MEVTKDIIFDTNLFQNETVKLTYKGYLFKANSTEVSIVYGYGDNWENTTEQPMKRTLNGFITDIKIDNFDKINFCFKNSYEEWDNNNYQDYHVDILPPISTNEPEPSDYSDIQEASVEKSTLLDEILGDYTLYFDNTEEFNFQKFIDKIVTEIIDESGITPSLAENVVAENTVVNAEISDFVNFELENNITAVEDIEEVVEESVKAEENDDLLFEKFSEDLIIDFERNVNYIQEQLDSLYVEDISLIDNSLNNFYNTLDEENLIEQSVSTEENDIYVPVKEEASLVEYDSNKFVIAARKLTPFYKFQKRVRLFFYKAFNMLPKLLNGEYNSDNN